MPTNLSDFVGGGKPKRITSYTSGTNTYIPTADMARCFVRIQAGGGGGSTMPQGGGGGAMVEVWCRVPIAGFAWIVGGGGASATNGSRSSFGPYTAMPGMSHPTAWSAGAGGILDVINGSVDSDGATMIPGRGLGGVSGGAGGNTYEGNLVGFPISDNYINGYGAPPAYNLWYGSNRATGNGQGVYSGGDSFYGKGGTTGNSPAVDAYGAGGGGHASTPGAGRGGYIEIWDYGV